MPTHTGYTQVSSSLYNGVSQELYIDQSMCFALFQGDVLRERRREYFHFRTTTPREKVLPSNESQYQGSERCVIGRAGCNLPIAPVSLHAKCKDIRELCGQPQEQKARRTVGSRWESSRAHGSKGEHQGTSKIIQRQVVSVKSPKGTRVRCLTHCARILAGSWQQWAGDITRKSEKQQ
ncbi:hypothetical protein VTO42DRAFT_7099 [Malbranchea cinnamomea]